MSLINIQHLTFAYEGSYDPIFDDTSFQIDTNWKLGFIGRNGRGKTTFLKLLLGHYEYTGAISASVSFDYFPYAVTNPTLNTLDILEEIVPDYEYWRLSKECSLLDLSEEILYRPFDTLSFGEQTKILLAALFLKENNFLLIDEPTNHLDLKAREIVSQYLKRKRSFILVSHDRFFLDACVDHILSINKTGIQVQQGNFSSWQLNKEYSDQFERGENEKLKKDIKRLSEAARRTSTWSDKTEKSKWGPDVPDRGFVSHKAAKLMKRSKSTEQRMEKAIDTKTQLLKNIETNEALKISPLSYSQQRLIEVNQLSLSFDQEQIFEHISFCINQGKRIAIQGKNGCGKSSLLKILLGEIANFQGTLYRGSNLIISYVSQDTTFLKGSLDQFALEQNIDLTLFKTILRKLDFSRIQFEKNMEDFSEGQKKKVLIAKSLCEQAHLYIWDEPLNFIDVLSRIQIEDLLLTYKPTMIFVEHDRTFTDRISTEIVSI